MRKSLTLCNGHRISWEARDPFTEEFLQEAARICGWENVTAEGNSDVELFLHGDRIPEDAAVIRPWQPLLTGALGILRPTPNELHFYLPPQEHTPKQLLFLRRLLSFLPLASIIATGDAALLHATLATRRSDGLGFLFSGGSGSGKSTSCNRLPDTEWQKHCDDAMLLVRTGDGYCAHSLPTWTKWFRQLPPVLYRGGAPIPVHRLCLLDHGLEDAVEELPATQQIIECSRNMIYLQYILEAAIPKQEAAALKISSFDFAREFCRNIPTRKLNATLDGKFWEFLY